MVHLINGFDLDSIYRTVPSLHRSISCLCDFNNQNHLYQLTSDSRLLKCLSDPHQWEPAITLMNHPDGLLGSFFIFLFLLRL